MIGIVLRHSMFLCLLAVLGLAGLAKPLQAGSDFDDVSRVTLLPGWQRADGLYVAAVKVDLDPGWKTYWRSPGDTGIAPIFDWSGSDNVGQVGYFWPSPHIIDEKGVRTIGYKDRLILPVLLKPRDAAEPVHLRLKLDYGICDDICLPARSKASLAVDRGQVLNRDMIDAAMALRSTPANAHGLQTATCGLRKHGDDFILAASFAFDGDLAAHRLVIVETGSEHVWVSEADHDLNGGSLQVEADLHYFGEGAMTLNRSDLRFTLINDGQSIEIVGCTGE